MGGDGAGMTFSEMVSSFNPRPRMGGDVTCMKAPEVTSVFQSTPPHGGRRRRNYPSLKLLCFNPRPRMGGDHILDDLLSTQLKFQSTPPHGGRHFHPHTITGIQKVSIHAPAWGATLHSVGVCIRTCFNPRPRMGGDYNTTTY